MDYEKKFDKWLKDTGIKVGDVVKIVRKPTRFYLGKRNLGMRPLRNASIISLKTHIWKQIPAKFAEKIVA